MYKFMHVGFAFAGVPKILDLEPVFNQMGDQWIRYSTSGWVMWTPKDAVTIYYTLNPHLDLGDNVLIAPLDGSACFGRLPPWMWEWLQQRQATITTHVPDLGTMLSNALLPKPK